LKYIPALGYRVLTPVFDTLESLTMPLARIAEAVKRLVELPVNGSLLDVGCGTGTLLMRFRKERPEARLAGVDPDPAVLRRAARKSAAAGLSIGRAFADALPFPDASFDAVVSTLVFHHLTTDVKRGAFREMRRVAKPGARIVIADFGKAARALHVLMQFPFRILDGYGVTADSARGRVGALALEEGLEGFREVERTFSVYGPVSFFRAVKK